MWLHQHQKLHAARLGLITRGHAVRCAAATVIVNLVSHLTAEEWYEHSTCHLPRLFKKSEGPTWLPSFQKVRMSQLGFSG